MGVESTFARHSDTITFATWIFHKRSSPKCNRRVLSIPEYTSTHDHLFASRAKRNHCTVLGFLGGAYVDTTCISLSSSLLHINYTNGCEDDRGSHPRAAEYSIDASIRRETFRPGGHQISDIRALVFTYDSETVANCHELS